MLSNLGIAHTHASYARQLGAADRTVRTWDLGLSGSVLSPSCPANCRSRASSLAHNIPTQTSLRRPAPTRSTTRTPLAGCDELQGCYVGGNIKLLNDWTVASPCLERHNSGSTSAVDRTKFAGQQVGEAVIVSRHKDLP